MGTAQEHRLHDEPSLEAEHVLHYVGHVVGRGRAVDQRSLRVGGGIQFEDGVVHLLQGLENAGLSAARGVGKDAHLGGRIVAVPQFKRKADDLREGRVQRGFPVSGEGDGVDRGPIGHASLQLGFQRVAHVFRGGEEGIGQAVLVPSALAVHAVKVTNFSFLRQKIDAQGTPQPAAEDGSKNRVFP